MKDNRNVSGVGLLVILFKLCIPCLFWLFCFVKNENLTLSGVFIYAPATFESMYILAKFDPRDMIGTVYNGKYTKYRSSGPRGFRKEYCFSFVPETIDPPGRGCIVPKWTEALRMVLYVKSTLLWISMVYDQQNNVYN